MNLVWSSHLKVGKAIPDPIATAKVTGTHFGNNTQYNEIVKTDDLDRVRKYHRDVPGDQSRQKRQPVGRPHQLEVGTVRLSADRKKSAYRRIYFSPANLMRTARASVSVRSPFSGSAALPWRNSQ